VEKPVIRNGLIAISDIIRKKITDVRGASILPKLNSLRTTIEGLKFEELESTGPIPQIADLRITELKAAIGGVTTGFRANLLKVRSLMKSTSFVDIRGCKIGARPTGTPVGTIPPMLPAMKNFLGAGAQKPTITAPDWWQSFPDGFRFDAGPKVYPIIDDLVTNGVPPDSAGNGSLIDGADVSTSLTLWKGLIDFTPHFTFISNRFADTNTARLDFTTLEWRTWQIAGAGPGIPVLRMEAQRIDDLATLTIENILERFRIIFEVPPAPAGGMTTAQITTIKGLQPLVVSFKALKDSITAIAAPTSAQIAEFYTKLGEAITAIDTVPGTNPPPADIVPAGAQDKSKLDLYAGKAEAYIFSLLNLALGPFFSAIRGQLGHANAQIRYYLNIGLVLPAQSIQHPTITNPVVIISFASSSDRARMFMKALRGWMKVQWKGSAEDTAALHARIDAIPVPALTDVEEFARRAVVSEDDPVGNPPWLPSHYCPKTEFDDHIKFSP
jgi:hypothetical protein